MLFQQWIFRRLCSLQYQRDPSERFFFLIINVNNRCAD